MLSPNTILLLGVWLIILRFLGIPSAWRNWLYVLTGVALLFIYARSAGQASLRRFLEARQADTFTQNGSGPMSVDGMNRA